MKDINILAPWVAIALTLILSILVPYFTQRENNKFQLKLKSQEQESQKAIEKIRAYEDFLGKAGACIYMSDSGALKEAGNNMSKIYLYAPKELYPKIDELMETIKEYDWNSSITLLQNIAKELSKDLEK